MVGEGDLCLWQGALVYPWDFGWYDLDLERGTSVPVLVEQLVVLELWDSVESSFKANFICCLKNRDSKAWPFWQVQLDWRSTTITQKN